MFLLLFHMSKMSEFQIISQLQKIFTETSKQKSQYQQTTNTNQEPTSSTNRNQFFLFFFIESQLKCSQNNQTNQKCGKIHHSWSVCRYLPAIHIVQKKRSLDQSYIEVTSFWPDRPSLSHLTLLNNVNRWPGQKTMDFMEP